MPLRRMVCTPSPSAPVWWEDVAQRRAGERLHAPRQNVPAQVTSAGPQWGGGRRPGQWLTPSYSTEALYAGSGLLQTGPRRRPSSSLQHNPTQAGRKLRHTVSAQREQNGQEWTGDSSVLWFSPSGTQLTLAAFQITHTHVCSYGTKWIWICRYTCTFLTAVKKFLVNFV